MNRPMGEVHTVGHGAVHIAVSATPDQLHRAFDDAIIRGLPLRVLSAHRDLHLNELGAIAALALAHGAVEALWQLFPRQPRLAVLHLVTPEIVPESVAAQPPALADVARVTTVSPGERTATPNPGETVHPCDCIHIERTSAFGFGDPVEVPCRHGWTASTAASWAARQRILERHRAAEAAALVDGEDLL